MYTKKDHAFLVKLTVVCFIIMCLAGIAGCNTVKGFGQDLYDGATTLERAIKKD